MRNLLRSSRGLTTVSLEETLLWLEELVGFDEVEDMEVAREEPPVECVEEEC